MKKYLLLLVPLLIASPAFAYSSSGLGTATLDFTSGTGQMNWYYGPSSDPSSAAWGDHNGNNGQSNVSWSGFDAGGTGWPWGAGNPQYLFMVDGPGDSCQGLTYAQCLAQNPNQAECFHTDGSVWGTCSSPPPPTPGNAISAAAGSALVGSTVVDASLAFLIILTVLAGVMLGLLIFRWGFKRIRGVASPSGPSYMDSYNGINFEAVSRKIKEIEARERFHGGRHTGPGY